MGRPSWRPPSWRMAKKGRVAALLQAYRNGEVGVEVELPELGAAFPAFEAPPAGPRAAPRAAAKVGQECGGFGVCMGGLE